MTSAVSPAPAGRAVSLTTIAAVSLCAFLIVLTLLAWSVGAGRDPALGRSAPSAKTQVVSHAKHHAAPVLVTHTSGGGPIR